MRQPLLVSLQLMALHYLLVMAAGVHEKAEAVIPIASRSPPEGNTTFLSGTSWCVARAGASPADLQVALDWACGIGKADCKPIQAGGSCFEPATVLSHASYAFNSYYQQNGNNDVACYFGGNAILTQNDPSYAKCSFDASEPMKSLAAPTEMVITIKVPVLLLLILHFLRLLLYVPTI